MKPKPLTKEDIFNWNDEEDDHLRNEKEGCYECIPERGVIDIDELISAKKWLKKELKKYWNDKFSLKESIQIEEIQEKVDEAFNIE